MPFMVIYRSTDGSSTHEQVEAIDEAALFVERLRNRDGVDQVRIYRMEEISFAFRPYYKVELGMPERQDHPAPPSDVVGTTTPAPAPAVVVDPDPAPRSDEPQDETVEELVAEVAPAPDDREPTGSTLDTGPNGARRGLFGR